MIFRIFSSWYISLPIYCLGKTVKSRKDMRDFLCTTTQIRKVEFCYDRRFWNNNLGESYFFQDNTHNFLLFVRNSINMSISN